MLLMKFDDSVRLIFYFEDAETIVHNKEFIIVVDYRSQIEYYNL